jgi:hypothetical protein
MDEQIIDAATAQIETSTSVGEVLAAVDTFNAGTEGRAAGLRDTYGVQASLIEKVKQWLDKLVAKLRELAEDVKQGIETFTITVGTTITVAVTFRGRG